MGGTLMATTINAAASAGLVTTADTSQILQLQTNGITGLTVDASQKVTFASTPATITPQSMVRLNTSNGYGSTNTVIKRYTTTVTNQGSDITYADSATLGATFTINTNGVYAVCMTASSASTIVSGLSINSTQLATTIFTITAINRLAINAGTTSNSSSVSWTGYLVVNDVVRPHTDGSSTSTAAIEQFTIVRIA